MKKFAYLLMGEIYCPEKHNMCFETKNLKTYFCTVRNYEEARKKVLELSQEGVGIIELCGAFDKTKVEELIELTNNKIGIGYSIHGTLQNHLFEEFFSKPNVSR